MADYATLLREHVTLTCRSVDRIFLQAYLPKLQTVGWVCRFLRWQRHYEIPSSAAFGKTCAYAPWPIWIWLNAHSWRSASASGSGSATPRWTTGSATAPSPRD